MTNDSHINRTRVSFGSTVMAGAVAAILLAATSTAEAKSTASDSARPATLRMRMVADNVVVSPGAAAAPAAAPAPSQTVVVPQASAPAQGAAVVDAPAKRTNVNVDAQQPHNYMTTIFVSALMGGLAGGLIGGAIYYLGDQDHAVNIAYWAAGGVLVGTGVGVAQLMVQESRVSNATASRFPSDPAPTLRLALVNMKF